MKKLLNKITAWDFRKPAKALLIVFLVVALVGGALSAWMLRTQISELAALDKAEEQNVELQQEGRHGGENGDGQKDEGDGDDPFKAGAITRPSVAAWVAFIGWLALCGLCAIVYWLLVAAWLYKAAVNAKMNRALWPILGLAFNLLAVAAFLIVRSSLSRCPKCGAWQKSGGYCTSCGSPMERQCPKCQKRCGGGDAYCPDCGAPLDAPYEPAEKQAD